MKAEQKISVLFSLASLLLAFLAAIAWQNNYVIVLKLLFTIWAVLIIVITGAWIKHEYFSRTFSLSP